MSTSKQKKRNTAKNAIQRHHAACTSEAFLQSRENVEIYTTMLEDVWSKFGVLQDSVEDACEAEAFEEEEKIRLDTERLYIEAITRLRRLHNELLARANATVKNQNTPNVHLPKLEIPQFQGDPIEWPTFHDAFTSLVHENNSLTNGQRMHYLRGCLKGEALQLIVNFKVCDSSYNEAWGLLKTRYQVLRVIVDNHLRAMCSIKPVEKDTAVAIKQVLDVVQQHLRGLRALERPVDTWDDWLVHLIVSKLAYETRKQWELSLTSNNMPTFEQLNSFLETRCRSLGMLTSSQESKQLTRKSASVLHSSNGQDAGNVKSNHCWFCEADHKIYTCQKFNALLYKEKVNAVKQRGACFNCLSEGHRANKCSSKSSCKTCGGRHHSLLHNNMNPGTTYEPKCQSTEQVSVSTASAATPSTTTTLSANYSCSNAHTYTDIVLLATALAYAADKSDHLQEVRILFDNGSHTSFITESCIQRLGLHRRAASTHVSGIGASNGPKIRGKTSLNLFSRYNSKSFIIDALILAKITNEQPAFSFKPQTWDHVRELQLADPHFFASRPVDILIGVDRMHQFLECDIRKGAPDAPIAHKTVLGWVLFGHAVQNSVANVVASSLICDMQLSDQVAKLWELEDPPTKRHFTPEEQRCEDIFLQTHKRAADGRFIVQLPFKDGVPLCNNRQAAVRCLLRMEKRFDEDEKLHKGYSEFMQELLDLGHMELASEQPENCYYMPHHAVVKESSSTTKLRVVFNASAKTTTGYSLNDSLMIGAQLQPDLFSILLKFRTHRYAMSADVQKMYRQVYVSQAHTDYQRIVWRNNKNSPIQDYKMLRVTYGVAAASHLAVRSMQEVALKADDTFKLAADTILNEFYMDDLLSGADDEGSLIDLQNEVTSLLSTGGFELRKWATNSSLLEKELPKSSNQISHFLSESQDIRTLGLIWNTDGDYLTFAINLKDLPPVLTKRSFLSDASTLFDPLGLLAPCTIKSKILFQRIWQDDVDWDEPVPLQIANEWQHLRKTITQFSNFKVGRWLGTISKGKQIELHLFADASERAYAAVMYARTIDESNNVNVSIVAARTKVAPLKSTSLPRLELCAAQLAAKLIRQTQTAFNHVDCKIFAWTDSTIVLAWVRSHPSRWSTYVANRVADIQEVLPADCWLHVRSEDNPADCASRSITPSQLMEFELWWKGPSWLRELNQNYHTSTSIQYSTELEKKNTSLLTSSCQSNEIGFLVTKFSSYLKLLRVAAYVLRVIKCGRKQKRPSTCTVSCQEQQEAEYFLIRYIQNIEFSKEMSLLRADKPIPLRSDLKRLQPFIDENGILRVGGRIKQAEVNVDVKHPILLPKNSFFAELLIRHIHIIALHAGPSLMLAILRRRFWVIDARNLVRKLYRSCTKCTLLNRTPQKQEMGDLPASRVVCARPFLHTAVDYAGPFSYKPAPGRGVKTLKGYICSFICMSSGAMHLEFAVDLSATAFLKAFRRFTNRRGFCQHLYSDNGTNFVGANKQLILEFNKCLKDEILQSYFADSRVTWHFNPPNAPHMGGYWEAGIKRIKYHLKRCIGETLLTYEEYATLLTDVEACVNSRPLCLTFNDASEVEVLTPGHLLTGEPLRALPDPDVQDFKGNLSQRHTLICAIRRHFWRRWHDEYLVSLQKRTKWFRSQPSLQEEDVVAVLQENCPPTKWKYAKVLKCHKGPDGRVRVVTLKTPVGEMTRPYSRICKLYSPSEC